MNENARQISTAMDAYRQSLRAAMNTKDQRPCKEQVKEFISNMDAVMAKGEIAASHAAEGKTLDALDDALIAERMCQEIIPPICALAAVEMHTNYLKICMSFRKAIEAEIEGRFAELEQISIESESLESASWNAWERLKNEYLDD